MTIHDIYLKTAKILNDQAVFHREAMKVMQSFTLNGFKRLHRCEAKKFFCLSIDLANDSFDKYRVLLDDKITQVDYRPTSIADHLTTWDDKLATGIKELGELNQEHLAATGITSCVIEDALKCMVKMYVHCGRWYSRFDQAKWLMHDIFVEDSRLHSLLELEEDGKNEV